MSCRQSARKVKLTSKFEEFNSSRLSKVISPKVEPGTRKTDKSLTQTPIAQATPVSSAPPSQAPSAPSTPLPQPTSAKQSKREIHHNFHSTPVVTPAPHDVGKPPPNYMPLKLTANGKIRGRPRKCWQKAETVVKPISSTREELLRLRDENANLKQQLERANADYEELKRQSSYTGQTVPKIDYDDLKEKYQRDLTHAKRHEWCVVCLSPSRYYCCWNTTYCSQKCQVSDWYQRHMKSCERRKTLKTVS